jgi:hypothetical protein
MCGAYYLFHAYYYCQPNPLYNFVVITVLRFQLAMFCVGFFECFRLLSNYLMCKSIFISRIVFLPFGVSGQFLFFCLFVANIYSYCSSRFTLFFIIQFYKQQQQYAFCLIFKLCAFYSLINTHTIAVLAAIFLHLFRIKYCAIKIL